MARHCPRCRPLIGAATIVLALSSTGAGTACAQDAVADKVVGPQACRACHPAAASAWERTRHFASRDVMGTPEARRVRDALGLKEPPEASPLCTHCHVTVRNDGGRARAIAGVSCESCHGGAAGWLKVHGDYGSGKTKASETPDHRDDRLGASMAAGMLRPENLYRVVENCFACHTVPQEALVNTGGHSAGSPIELVTWSQGAIRHNFGPDGRNAEASIERRRQLLVLGRMLDLEFALRGLAAATVDGAYARALTTRGQLALAELQKLGALVTLPEVEAVLRAGTGARLTVGNSQALLAAAEAVSTAAQDFGDAGHRPELAALDPLLPSSDQYKGAPYSP